MQVMMLSLFVVPVLIARTGVTSQARRVDMKLSELLVLLEDTPGVMQ